jgi:hypothetical protein
MPDYMDTSSKTTVGPNKTVEIDGSLRRKYNSGRPSEGSVGVRWHREGIGVNFPGASVGPHNSDIDGCQ